MVATETPHIEADGFGFLPNSCEIVRRYTITNKNKAFVKLISLGAAIQSITVPNKNNDMADVILGFDNVTGYLENRYIGRIVARITKSFAKKSKNTGDFYDYDIVNWDSYILGKQVVMTHIAREGDEENPCATLIEVKYTWTDQNQLHVDICASSTKSTPINISSHCLFNLAGHGMGAKELHNHVVTVNADEWSELDLSTGLLTGVTENVDETLYDFRSPIRLNTKTLYKVPGGGYNHNLFITSPSSTWSYRFHARMLHPPSGRSLEIYSNHPAMQLYTANDMPDPKKIYPPNLNEHEDNAKKPVERKAKVIGKDGMPYRRFGCFGLISQGYIKTLECCHFPSNVLYPGKIYVHNITYDFGMIS